MYGWPEHVWLARTCMVGQNIYTRPILRIIPAVKTIYIIINTYTYVAYKCTVLANPMYMSSQSSCCDVISVQKMPPKRGQHTVRVNKANEQGM